MVKDSIAVAIIGAGSMAREHIRVFSSIPTVNIVGIFSRTRSRADDLAREFSIKYVANSVEDLYVNTKADLVVIAVPELSVNSVSKSAFIFPWSVLMEKPAGYDLADAENIAAHALVRTAPVMVGFNRRFYSSVLAVKSDLNMRISERRFIHVQDQQSYSEARRFNHPEEVVKKFMYANSIHLIDMIVNFGRGNICKVEQVTPWLGDKTEIMIAYIEFDSGDSALYEGIWKGPGPWACSISTQSRRWSMQPLEEAVYQNANERTRTAIPVSDNDQKFKPGFYLQATAAVERAMGRESDIATLSDSLKVMKLINKIFGI